MSSFRELIVWQKSYGLRLAVYRVSSGFPSEEKFGMIPEIRKTARPVLYNIAEGHQRRSTVEYLQFLNIAAGSRAELETQLLLATSLGYLSKDQSASLIAQCDEVAKLLTATLRTLREKSAAQPRVKR